MKKILGSVALGVYLLVPIAITQAQDHPPIHRWNDGENPAWHQYLKERRIKDHEWARANRREQAAYWRWRDAHRDIH